MIAALYLVGFIYSIGAARIFGGPLRRNLFNPITLFLLIYGFAYFFVPALVLVIGGLAYQPDYTTRTWILALFAHVAFTLSTVAIYAFLGGTTRFVMGWRYFHDFSRWKPLSRLERATAYLVFLVPAVFSLMRITALISAYGYAPFLANRIRIMSGYGYLLMPLAWISIYGVLIAADFAVRPFAFVSWLRRVEVLAIPLIAGLAGLVIGSRGGALFPVLWSLFAYATLRSANGVRWSYLLRLTVAGLGLLVFGVGLGTLRGRVIGGQIDASKHLLSASIASTMTQGFVEAYSEYENTLWLIEHKTAFDPLKGATFGAAAVGYVPRAIWETKPLGGGPRLRNMIHPGSYDLNSDRTLTSYTTGLPAEAMMNFGYAGFVIIGGLYGFALWLLVVSMHRLLNPIAFTLWFFAYYYLISVLSAEVFGTVAHLFAAVIPLIAMMLISSVMNVKQYRRANYGTWPNPSSLGSGARADVR